MVQQASPSSPDDKYGRCPIRETHRRLAEAHVLWHQTLDNYDNPEVFRANLNATIEALRNTTFILQSEKAAFDAFDEWYGAWRTRLGEHSAAKWLKDARTTVVHQGELESQSSAEIRLVSWRDEVLGRFNVAARATPSQILQDKRLRDLLDHHVGAAEGGKEFAIAIERRWSTPELGGNEILETLAKVYSVISDLVLDAHLHLRQCGCIPNESDHPDFGTIYHRTGTLECMVMGAEKRTRIFELATGNELQPMRTPAPPLSPGEGAYAARRYGFDKAEMVPSWEKLNPVRLAERILYRAKRILCRDKSHSRIMFVRDGKGDWYANYLVAQDREEKHLLMRMVANLVESRGCDAIIEVAESWAAPVKYASQIGQGGVEGLKERGEVLNVFVGTRDGFGRMYTTPFTRGRFGGIKLGDTRMQDGWSGLYYLAPVFGVWRRQGLTQTSDGRRVPKVWEPDPMDICFCGGPRRFGECCGPHIPLRRDLHEAFIEAMAASDFNRAEALARAYLAQYVIWVKQHTVPTMNVAPGLHEKIVNIDVMALNEIIDWLQESLEANGNSGLFVPQLQHLASVIGVPRLSMRLVALGCRWLFAEGRIEEAVLELDGLGSLDKVDDTVALVTAFHILDPSPQRAEELLTRASSVAACDEEKWAAQILLAESLLSRRENAKALAVVESILAESQGPGDRLGPPTEALILHWRITKADRDFHPMMEAVRRSKGSKRTHFAAMMIDAGLYAEAEELLEPMVKSGELVSTLLTVDARTRSGNAESAPRLFETVDRKRLPKKYLYPYAVAAAHLAIACKDDGIRELAIVALREVSASRKADEGVQELLRILQGQ